MKQDYEKQKIAIRYWLLGRGYTTAIKAMDFAEKLHTGTRKDGNHEFSHQVSQANFARTLIDTFTYPEETMAVIFLHDVAEDCGTKRQELVELFGERIAEATIVMSKEYMTHKHTNMTYYHFISENEIATLSKGFDRLHNLMTMLGGFTPEKQISYITETMEYVVPMLKKARRSFPKQEAAYENIKFVMTNQVMLYNELNKVPVLNKD
jgi:(p)ppGpp synthase/HD superfamily hydrolase